MRIKIRPADTLFSNFVRERAGWRCEYCFKDYSDNPKGLHCSHYWGRGRENTRFDSENCVALCFYHHNKLGHGDDRDFYTEFMVKRLGQKGFNNLKVRAFQYCKKDDKLALMYIKQLQDELDDHNKRSATRAA